MASGSGWPSEKLDLAGKAVSEASPETPKSSKTSLSILRFVIGLGILLAVLWFVDLGQFVSSLLSVNPWIFCAMIAAALGARFIRAWKWKELLSVGGIGISTWQAIRLSLVSHFTGAWTPGQLGGDAYRVLALRKFGRSDVVLSTLLIERYAGFCAVSFFACLSLPVTVPHLYRESPWVLALVLAAILAVSVVIPCLFNRRIASYVARIVPGFKDSKIGRKLREFYKTTLSFRKYPTTLFVYALTTLFETFIYFIVNYLAARCLGLDVSLVFFLFAMPIVHLLLRIPVSFQGVGIQEGCFVYALVLHGFTPAEGLAISVLQRALEWIVSISPGGLLMWLTPDPVPKDTSQPDAQDQALHIQS